MIRNVRSAPIGGRVSRGRSDAAYVQSRRQFPCDHPGCGRAYRNRSHLNAHKILTHVGERRYQCQCGKAFASSDLLRRHERMENLERPFVCSICAKTFSRKDHLNTHRSNTHGQFHENQAFGGSYSPRSQQTTSYSPPFSNFSCGNIQNENTSPKRMNKIRNVRSVPIGGRVSRGRSDAADVQSRRRIPCDHPGCGRSYTKRSHLNDHKIRTHAGERRYQCQCGKAFASSDLLRRHERKENGERPFVCDICGNRFRRKDNLNTHMSSGAHRKIFASSS